MSMNDQSENDVNTSETAETVDNVDETSEETSDDVKQDDIETVDDEKDPNEDDKSSSNEEKTNEKKAGKKKNKENNKLEALKKELDENKDMLLRLKAEYANFRKRSEKEKSETYSFATAATLKELLPIIDNLERALQNDNNDYDALKKGVQMTYDGVLESLKKLNVEMYCEKGDIFDPNLHNAVMHVEDDEHKDGEIVDVYQKGYKIGDKVIRPAMVKTAN